MALYRKLEKLFIKPIIAKKKNIINNADIVFSGN
jgi:hypothetical protein